MTSGAQVVARCLAAAGVRHVFSVSGNQVLSLYDALFEAEVGIVHARHEGAAVHMADAYGRLTGSAGVCLVTAGPGHANALGALSMAEAAESAVVLLSGHAPLGQRGAFQEMDQVGLARPLTRRSEVVRAPSELAGQLAATFRAAASGRAGPAHLSLPVEVLAARLDEPHAAPPPGDAFAPRRRAAPAAAVARITALLREASRPLIVAGQCARQPGVYEALAAFAARGAIPLLIVDHPRGLADPTLGQAGQALPRADAVLLFGKRQDYRIAYGRAPLLAPDCRLAQVDPWPDEIGRHRPVEVGVAADPATVAAQLLDAGGGSPAGHTPPPAPGAPAASTAWCDEVEALREASPLPALRADLAGGAEGEALHPLPVCDEIAALVERIGWAGITLTIDGGDFGQWVRARLRPPPARHLVAEPLGSIGFSLPFALAARLARPQPVAVAVAGDGAFGFHALELETAARVRAPFLTIVGNDGAWGTERHLQLNRFGRAVATDLLPVRYDLLAAALGGYGERVERLDRLGPAFERALAAVRGGRPAVVDVRLRSVPSPSGEPPSH
jgi:acetolactate synthase-1/2/3 large subunit